jgi:hypothetical protein
MAGEGNSNLNILSFLDTIQPQGQIQTDVESINNYIPSDLSPDQVQAYQAQNQPSTGQLPLTAYYPDAGHNIGVGGYSGSEIGSTTLFAPGGGLVPLGMLDARDAAVKNAAMRKQKEMDDFYKQYQSPTTKHVAVQKDLSEAYNTGLQQWNQNALKKAGGDQALANRMLMQDNNFRAWNKSMQDTAKFHDAIVEHAAQLAKDEKDPNFVLSPETKRLTGNLMSGVQYQGIDPFSKEGRDIGAKYLAAAATYDIDKSVNTAIDKAIPTIDQLPPTFQGRGKNEIATFLEKEYFTPEARKALAHNIYMEKYIGTGVTEEMVQKNVDAKLGEKIKRKTDTYDKYFKPDQVEPDYSIVPETNVKVNVNTSAPGTINAIPKEADIKSFVPLNATHEKQEISFPINKATKDLGGSALDEEAGSFKGTVSGFGIAYIDKASGKISVLTDEEMAEQQKAGKLNHNIRAVPVALVNKKGKVAPLPAAQLKQLLEPLQIGELDEKGNKIMRDETEEEIQSRVNVAIAKHNEQQEEGLNKLIPVPIEEIEGKYPKKKGQKISVDDKISETKTKAQAMNEELKRKFEEAKNKSKEILQNEPKKIKVGDVVGGYKFMGGNPNDSKNWKKQ